MSKYKCLVLKIFTQHFRSVFLPKSWQNRPAQCLVYKAICELVIRYSLKIVSHPGGAPNPPRQLQPAFLMWLKESNNIDVPSHSRFVVLRKY